MSEWTGSWCPECGPDVSVDEEGCCAPCGATATGDGVEAALQSRREVERLRKRNDQLLATLRGVASGEGVARGALEDHPAIIPAASEAVRGIGRNQSNCVVRDSRPGWRAMMCDWGNTVPMAANGRVVDVDRCIAHIVAALNAGGLDTIASCCGHGHRPGRITLKDGRDLFVAGGAWVDAIEDAIPVDIHGDPIRRPGGTRDERASRALLVR